MLQRKEQTARIAVSMIGEVEMSDDSATVVVEEFSKIITIKETVKEQHRGRHSMVRRDNINDPTNKFMSFQIFNKLGCNILWNL